MGSNAAGIAHDLDCIFGTGEQGHPEAVRWGRRDKCSMFRFPDMCS